ncbi:MAG: hypothetical protein QOG72_1201 [Sphingomonadales bacterium]|jgi:hypothetical protein|nr:hypothetical protein [Sphingomonadales bacterium]
MRRFFKVLAVPLLLVGLTAAHEKSNREEEGLLGPVRSVSSRMTHRLMGLDLGEAEAEGRPQQQDLVVYDAEGNEAERTIYDDFGFLGGRQVNKRDSSGHLVEAVLSDPKGVLMARYLYVYADDRVAETVHYDRKGKVELREVNSYGEQGRLSEVTYRTGSNAVGRTVYRYDSAGLRSETLFFMPDGSKAVAPIGPCLGAHRITFTYDEKGRPHEAVSYEPSGAMKKSWLYAYNGKGLMSEEKFEDSYKYTTNTHVYEYDSRGNWIKRITTMIQRPKADRLSAEEKKQYPRLMEPTEARVTITRTISYY